MSHDQDTRLPNIPAMRAFHARALARKLADRLRLTMEEVLAEDVALSGHSNDATPVVVGCLTGLLTFTVAALVALETGLKDMPPGKLAQDYMSMMAERDLLRLVLAGHAAAREAR
jgi:hypothetical protein